MTVRIPCPRCRDGTEDLVADGTAGEVSFWSCDACKWHFTRHEDGELTERWLGPISLALYGVIFEREPQLHVDRVMSQLDVTPAMLHEIERELAEPTQRVSRIHGSVADEASCREFLRLLVDRLR